MSKTRSKDTKPSLQPWRPHRVLVIPDKFKGTLSSGEAGRAIMRGLRRVWRDTRFTCVELSDGGDGFARILTQAAGGTLHRAKSVDAVGRPCWCTWGMMPDERTAVIDIASASGLGQLPASARDPSRASSYGTGLLIRRAIVSGARTVIVGLGGSATNDGGVGMAAALGYRFLDRHGAQIPLTGAGLASLARIHPPEQRLGVKFIAATDVDNPLYGAHGAARQFGPQKGATPDMVSALDRGLRRLARIVGRDLHHDFATLPGAGAAGGCGFALMALFAAKRVAGFDLLRRWLQLDALLAQHDLVVTGEGRFDRSSLAGKAPVRIAALARSRRVPAWGVFGQVELTANGSPFGRVEAVVTTQRRHMARLAAAAHAHKLADAATRLARS